MSFENIKSLQLGISRASTSENSGTYQNVKNFKSYLHHLYKALGCQLEDLGQCGDLNSYGGRSVSSHEYASSRFHCRRSSPSTTSQKVEDQPKTGYETE